MSLFLKPALLLKPALHSAAGLSLLTLVALLASPAVQAQGLTLGAPASSPGASGAGTISGSGTNATGNYAFSDGATAATENYSSVDAYGAGSAASMVALQSGGSIAALTLYDDSQALVAGGSVTSLLTASGQQPDPFNTAGFSITGGSVSTILEGSQGLGSISGGTIGSVTDRAPGGNLLNISGGTVGTATLSSLTFTNKAAASGGSIGTFNLDGSALNMSGGSLDSLVLDTSPEGSTGVVNTSDATITGGHVAAISTVGFFRYNPPIFNAPQYATCTIQGGTFGTLASTYYGGYNIDGTDLQLFSNGLVTGTLLDGETLNANFTNTDGKGFIDFNGVAAIPQAVPEASTISLGLLLALGAGGLVTAKRRSSVIAPSA